MGDVHIYIHRRVKDAAPEEQAALLREREQIEQAIDKADDQGLTVHPDKRKRLEAINKRLAKLATPK